MVDSVLRVIIDGQPAADGAKTVVNSIENVTKAAKAGTAEVASMQDQLSKFKSIGAQLGDFLKTIIPLDALVAAGKAIFEVTNRLQGFVSTMSVVSGSAQQARDELNYLVMISNKWGVSLDALTGPYSKMSAAAKGTALEGSALREVFESITMASSAMHLSTQDTTLVFFALQQMVSKGRVSMEELRKQLAERFPGAVQLAAESLNTTVDNMEKMIRAGKVLAVDFLPNFAKKIQEAFGTAAEVSSKSLLSELQRLHTAWELVLIKFSESSVISAASEVVKTLTGILTGNSDAAGALGDVVGGLITEFDNFLKGISPEAINTSLSLTIEVLKGVAWALGILMDAFNLIAPVIRGFAVLVEEFLIVPIKATIAALEFMIKLPGALWQSMNDGDQGAAITKLWADVTSGIDAAALANKRFGTSNLDARDLQLLNIQVGERALDVQKKSLANNEAQATDNQRQIDIKLKNISATVRLSELEQERAGYMKTINEGDRSSVEGLKDINKAYVALNGTTKDFIAASKAVAAEMKAGKGHTASYADDIAKLKMSLSALTNSNSGEYPELSKAMKKVAEDRAKGLKQSKDEIQGFYDAAAAIDENNIALKKNADIWKGYEDSWKRSLETEKEHDDALMKVSQSIYDQNKQLEIEHATIGMSDAQKQLYIATLARTEAAYKDNTNAVMLLNKQMDLLRQKESDTNMMELGKNLSESFKEVGNSLSDALFRAFENGESFASAFKKTLMNAFKTMILKPVIQMVMAPVTSMGMGALGFSQNSAGNWVGGGASSLSGLGDVANIGNAFSNFGSSAFGSMGTAASASMYSTFGGAGTQQAAMLAAQTADFGFAGTGSTLSALGGSGSIMGPLMAAAPYIAAAVAIGMLVKSVLDSKKGGPKSGGYGSAGDISSWDRSQHFTPNSADSEMASAASTLLSGFESTLKALGGTSSGAGFDIGYDTDPQGTANNRLGVRAMMGGKQVYNYWSGDNALGRDQATLEKAIALETKRAMVAALQASDLPESIAAVFDKVDVSTMTSEDLDNLIAFGGAMKSLIDVLANDPVTSAQKAWEDSQRTAVQVLRDMGSEVISLSDNMDGTTASMQALSKGTADYSAAIAKVLLDIKKMKKELTDMFSGVRSTLEQIGMSNEEQYNYIGRQIKVQEQIIATSKDPYEIDAAARLVTSLFQQQMGLLTPEQLAERKPDFLTWWTDFEGFVQGRMDLARDGIISDSVDPLAAASAALDAAASTFDASVDKHVGATNNFNDGVNAWVSGVDRWVANLPLTAVVRTSEVNA